MSANGIITSSMFGKGITSHISDHLRKIMERQRMRPIHRFPRRRLFGNGGGEDIPAEMNDAKDVVDQAALTSNLARSEKRRYMKELQNIPAIKRVIVELLNICRKELEKRKMSGGGIFDTLGSIMSGALDLGVDVLVKALSLLLQAVWIVVKRIVVSFVKSHPILAIAIFILALPYITKPIRDNLTFFKEVYGYACNIWEGLRLIGMLIWVYAKPVLKEVWRCIVKPLGSLVATALVKLCTYILKVIGSVALSVAYHGLYYGIKFCGWIGTKFVNGVLKITSFISKGWNKLKSWWRGDKEKMPLPPDVEPKKTRKIKYKLDLEDLPKMTKSKVFRNLPQKGNKGKKLLGHGLPRVGYTNYKHARYRRVKSGAVYQIMPKSLRMASKQRIKAGPVYLIPPASVQNLMQQKNTKRALDRDGGSSDDNIKQRQIISGSVGS